jgi:NAD(P)-dependent dehydrogenase (short-subunit alcohol dehydrogenase family)
MRPVGSLKTPTAGCLDGRVCLVLGAGALSKGWAIGQAIAIAYARAGARVMVGDQNLEAANATVRFIQSQGAQAQACEVDVTSEVSVQNAVSNTVSAFGALHVLHNNVGIGKSGDSAQTTALEWQRISDANLLALHLASQAAIPCMRKAGGGVILCTSSIASHRYVGIPHLAYGVTKAATNQFCKMMAVEYAPDNIRVNALVVGLVDTPRIRNTLMGTYGQDEEAMVRRRNAQIPLGEMGDAWDVANAAVFLASDRARFISGIELVIDGGMSATVRGG